MVLQTMLKESGLDHRYRLVCVPKQLYVRKKKRDIREINNNGCSEARLVTVKQRHDRRECSIINKNDERN